MTGLKSGKLGKRGELAIKNYLTASGYTVIATNLKIGRLEIDLIASHQGWLYFFEIKTRHSYSCQASDSLISRQQIANLKMAAKLYIASHNLSWERVHFDLLVIYFNEKDNKATIKRFRDIF